MNPPLFTACATAFAVNPRNGEKIFRSANASSSVSEADAQQKAKALAQRHAQEAANAQPQPAQRPPAYPYGTRSLVEPVIERVMAGGDREIARITRNCYGAAVLNAYGVLFADVDTDDDGSPAADALIVPQDEALGALVDLAAARADLAFRVYATKAGLRYLCTSRLFDPTSDESDGLLKVLKSDRRYTMLCRRQKCYRARLSPKPWRCFAEVPITGGPQEKPRGFFAKLLGAGKPRMQRLDEPEDFAVCRFIQAVGEGKVMPPEVARIVSLHDEACGVATQKPLA